MSAAHRPIIVLAEPIAPAPLSWLAQRATLTTPPTHSQSDRQPLFDTLADAQGLIIRTYTRVNRDLLDHAPNLRVIARAGVGLDNIDLDACRARSIRVVHTPSANTGGVVEYVTQMMLRSLRQIDRLDGIESEQSWHRIRQESIADRSCVGATLGIVGFGQIGSALAQVAGALSMKVIYHDLRPIPKSQRGGSLPVGLDELGAASDVISIHVDGRADNHHLIGGSFFDRLGAHAIFINTARGFVVDPVAAIDFAKANPGATLILDVHDPEPIVPDSAFFALDNVWLTPHIAAGTQSAKEAMSWVVRDLVAVLDGKPPAHAAV